MGNQAFAQRPAQPPSWNNYNQPAAQPNSFASFGTKSAPGTVQITHGNPDQAAMDQIGQVGANFGDSIARSLPPSMKPNSEVDYLKGNIYAGGTRQEDLRQSIAGREDPYQINGSLFNTALGNQNADRERQLGDGIYGIKAKLARQGITEGSPQYQQAIAQAQIESEMTGSRNAAGLTQKFGELGAQWGDAKDGRMMQMEGLQSQRDNSLAGQFSGAQGYGEQLDTSAGRVGYANAEAAYGTQNAQQATTLGKDNFEYMQRPDVKAKSNMMRDMGFDANFRQAGIDHLIGLTGIGAAGNLLRNKDVQGVGSAAMKFGGMAMGVPPLPTGFGGGASSVSGFGGGVA